MTGIVAAVLVNPVALAVVAPEHTHLTGDPVGASTVFEDRRISVPSGDAFYGSQFQVMTRDGAHVFVISSSDLTSNSDGYQQGGVFDLVAARAVPVACQGCIAVDATSADGSVIVGLTPDRLVAADTDDRHDLYLFDASGPRLIEGATSGVPRVEAMTDDASFLVFSSIGRHHPSDTDGETDLYRWSRATGTVDLLTAEAGTADPTFRALAADGSSVIWDLGAQSEIYGWRAGVNTVRGYGTYVDASEDHERVYSNGFVALLDADQDEVVDGYLSDAAGFHVLTEPSPTAYAPLAAVKEDGSAWVMITAQSLVEGDVNGKTDAYVRTAADTTRLSRGDGDVSHVMMSEDFTSAIYRTRARLVEGDTDEWDDVYRWTAADEEVPEAITTVGQGDVSLVGYATEGDRAFVSSWGQLLPEDTDPYEDVYEYVDGRLRLLMPGDKGYKLQAFTPDLARAVVSAGALTPEDTNGSVSDVYLSDADQLPPTLTIAAPPSPTGATTSVAFATGAGDGIWYDCQLDGAAWSRCSSPHQLTNLASGPHELRLRAYDAAANVNEGAVALDVEAVAPVGSLAIARGASFVRSVSVDLAADATDALSAVSHVALSNNGTTWTTRTYAASQPWTLTSTNGTKTVWAKWRDAAGNWSAPKTDTIVLDTVAPGATAPKQSIAAGSAISSGAVPVKLAWSGSDGTAGVARDRLRQSTDGGAWTTVSSTRTASSLSRALTPGRTYRFAVQAVDKAGNTGPYAYGPTFRVSGVSEASSSVRYAGAWSSVSYRSYWGGTARASSSAGATASFTFTGRSVGWVAIKAPNRGKATVSVNGTLVATVDLSSATTQTQRIVWSRNWSTSASRTVTIRVSGTAGRPRVDVDGFAVGS